MTEQPKFWTVPKKVALAILLGVLFSWLFGCSNALPKVEYTPPTPLVGNKGADTNVPYLKESYQVFNERYFGNHLTKNPTITTDLTEDDIANSSCENDDGTDCTIRFNLRYAAAPRVAQSTLLHEMCHIKVWSKSLSDNKPPDVDVSEYNHGRPWRACMLALDSAGAFREINIDYYNER